MKKFLITGMAAGGVGAAAVLFFFDPNRVPIYPVCMFHEVTGLDCPGCGSLRAMHELLHGHLIAALHLNLFLVISLPLFGWFAFRCLWPGLNGKPVPTIRPLWIWLYVGAWIAWGVLRNLPIPLFAAFAP